MKTILLTGSSGFIGWNTAKILLDHGSRVIGVDNVNDYYSPILKKFRTEDLKKHKKFSFIKADISSKEVVDHIFRTEKISAVINLAARAGVRYSIIDPWVYLESNITGTLNLLEAMKEHKVSKFVLASSSSLYAGQDMPFVEDLSVNKPLSPYAASKKSAEMIAYSYHHLFDIDVSILRYFTVFGPAGRPDMSYFNFIESVINQKSMTLYGDGSQSRDFTYVEDIARGTVEALKPLGYEIINLGGGNDPYTIKYMIDKIETLTNKKAIIEKKDFHKADMQTTWADITKAKKILGWEPYVSFDSGLENTVNWHLNNRKLLNSLS